MPKILVESLYQSAIESFSDHIWNCTKYHADECEICMTPRKVDACHCMKSVKEWLTLPHNIIQDIFDEIREHFLYENDSEDEFDFLHLITWLLHSPQLRIKRADFFEVEDMFYIMKFADNIEMLAILDWEDFSENPQLWKTLLFCACNIRVISLSGVPITDSIFQVIGEECSQLRVLNWFRLHNSVSSQLFEKLCYRNQNGKQVRNLCCDTLELIHVRAYSGPPSMSFEHEKRIMQEKLNQYAPFLLKHVINLKSLGHSFDACKYFDSIQPDAVPETGLDSVVASHMSPLLKTFCPKVRELDLKTSIKQNINDLDLFPLEKLTVEVTAEKQCFPCCHEAQATAAGERSANDDFIFSKVFNKEWKFLKNLDCTYIKGTTLYLTSLAKNLPCLETLSYENFDKVEWNGTTYFKNLKRGSFTMDKVLNILWARSFANTVEGLSIYWDDEEESNSRKRESCSVFTTVDFPVLERILVGSLKYDFDFMKNIIQHCPMLEYMRVIANEEEEKQLSQYLAENGFDLRIKPGFE